MILPGTPSGRPCALAKTPARTRKHCNFLLSPSGTRKSDNVYFLAAPLPIPTHRPPAILFLFTQHLFMPNPSSARPHLPASFHKFPGFQPLSRPRSPRLIIMDSAFTVAPARHSRTLAGIIGPSHIRYLDSSDAAICDRPATLGHSKIAALPHFLPASPVSDHCPRAIR